MARRLDIGNFRYGMRRDAGLQQDGIRAMRTIKNYRLDYGGDKVKLVVRKGYDRWNDTELAGPATQLEWFRDTDGNENLIGLVDSGNSFWYAIKETGAHVKIDTAIATAPLPTVQVGKRLFFMTDSTWKWTDNDSIGGVTTSYRVGIKKPTVPPGATWTTDLGNVPTESATVLSINDTTRKKLAIPFTVSTNEFMMNGTTLSLARFWSGDLEATGSIRLGLYEDDGGDPAASLYDDDAVSDWMSVEVFYEVSSPPTVDTAFGDPFQFRKGFVIPPGDYWLVLEGDAPYYASYTETVGPASGDFFITLGHEDSPGAYTYGRVKISQDGSTWAAVDKDALFQFHGQTATKFFDYVYTYLNSTYGIESRPSDKSRISLDPAGAKAAYVRVLTHGGTTDGQVDKVRYYRRDVASYTTAEADITDSYKLLGESTYSEAVYEALPSGSLGAELQTTDHYCYDTLDNDDTNLRESALVPFVMTEWKGRIIFAEEDSNILHFTKRLAEDGATGQTGDAIYDFLPLENRQEMPVASSIIGIKELSQNQLAIYFKDESVWVIRGMNEVINPPSDISRVPVLSTLGLFAPNSLVELKGRHAYMSTDGIYIFNGAGNPEFASVYIQSIFDAINLTYLDDTVMAVNGNEIWVLVDDDNDGNLESVYILDLQQNLQPWRQYDYGVNLNYIVTRPLGGTFRTILAADADSNYILELEIGTTDNDEAIEALVEPHFIEVAGEIAVQDIAVRGSYPDAPPTYRVTLIDHTGEETQYSIMPANSKDIRGHHTGCRMLSSNRIKAMIQQWSVAADQFRGFIITYQVR